MAITNRSLGRLGHATGANNDYVSETKLKADCVDTINDPATTNIRMGDYTIDEFDSVGSNIGTYLLVDETGTIYCKFKHVNGSVYNNPPSRFRYHSNLGRNDSLFDFQEAGTPNNNGEITTTDGGNDAWECTCVQQGSGWTTSGVYPQMIVGMRYLGDTFNTNTLNAGSTYQYFTFQLSNQYSNGSVNSGGSSG